MNKCYPRWQRGGQGFDPPRLHPLCADNISSTGHNLLCEHIPPQTEILHTFCRHSRRPVPAKGETGTLDSCSLILNAVHRGEGLVCPLAGKVVS